MKTPSNGYSANSGEGERKAMNSELWHACAGPLVSLPPVGSLVVYFPQGHSEQVAASMQKHTDDVPGYPNLPSKLICMLHNVTLHADPETDEVYAQMTLQPVNKCDQEALLVSDMGLKQNRQPSEFFCKTLTNSDTSTHGGFSVPRRAAEKIFPPLDFSMQPPAQELVARDLHDQAWTFRHIFRGQPKRHLLTTGWSVFISSKRLIAGDSVLFIRDDKSQHLLGIRRANKQQPALSSSVISSDSMHIGILAAAAHAAANNSPFTIFYNPRASPCEFVIPLAKYNKAMYNQVSLGMRFRMMFETEDCGVRRYMGTISGVGDLDPVRWKSSQWRNLQVGWDESAAGERPNRVSIWEIEPVVTPFYICPPPFFRPKFPKQPGFPDDECDTENGFKRGMPWVNDGLGLKDGSSSMFPGLNLVQWMSMQQQNTQPGLFPSNLSPNDHSKLLSFQSPQYSPSALQFGKPNPLTQPPSWPHHQPQPQPQARQQPQQHHNQNHQQYHQQNHQQNYQQNHQQQQMQQIMQSSGVNTSVVPNQSPHQQSYSHLQQQNIPVASRSLPQESQFHQQSDQHQRSQMPSFPDQQIQLQILQKLQQKHHQQQQIMPSFTPVTSYLEPQTLQQHLPIPQRQLSGTSFSTTLLLQSPQSQQKQSVIMKVNSGPIDVDVPSCSTSPSTNNCQVLPSNFINKNQGRSVRMEAPPIDATSNPVHDLQRHSAIKMKDEVTSLKGTSSATSYSMDANTLQQNFSVPNYSIEGDVQLNSRNTLPFTEHIDGLTPDALLSRGYDSGKEIQNLLSDYDTNRDFETDLSNAGINIQSFGMPQNMSFKSGCSNDVPVNVNDTNILNNGVWPNGPNQTQPPPPRMRTYTKVQKRGSVGRTIDVTRYKDYNELRHDLARMFGIEGQLEDSQRTDWKLVYVDHENDILLVGDDPWEEFVSCVQSIKILSTGEVQQMSLNGDLGGHVAVTVPNQACSGSESGNAWRGQYDDNSAASFNQ